MQITKRHWVAAGIGFVIAVLAFFGWTYRSQAPTLPGTPDTTATTTPATPATTTTTAAPARPFTLNSSDTIASWSFKGAYTGNETLVAKANSEIARLTDLLGTGEYTDYILYVSIANQYDLLGDGANEFAYLKKALALDSTQTGLAWYNAGHLLTRLGAYATARTAFERAVAAELVPQYSQALTDFLEAHYPSSGTGQ